MKNLFTNQEAVTLGFLAVEFADAFDANREALRPQLQPGTLLADEWVVDGHLIAKDTLFPCEEECVLCVETVSYGLLAHRKDAPNKFVVIVRGTHGMREWLIDANAIQKTHPVPGCGDVEAGFFSIYETMEFLPAADDTTRVPAWLGIADVVKNGELTVVGHSLGAALSTYLALDLAVHSQVKGNALSVCLFASPRAGDSEFVQAFDNTIHRYVVYQYVNDVVPHLPPSFMGYRTLRNVHEITTQNAEAIIEEDMAASHHLLCYCAMLSYHATKDWKKLLIANHDDPNCIIGPNVHQASDPAPAFDESIYRG